LDGCELGFGEFEHDLGFHGGGGFACYS